MNGPFGKLTCFSCDKRNRKKEIHLCSDYSSTEKLPTSQRPEEKENSTAQKSIPMGHGHSGQTELRERHFISEVLSAGWPDSESVMLSGTQVREAWPPENGPSAVAPSGCKIKMVWWEDPCHSPLETSSILGQKGQVGSYHDLCSGHFQSSTMGLHCDHQIQLVFRQMHWNRDHKERKTWEILTILPSGKSLLVIFQSAVAITF